MCAQTKKYSGQQCFHVCGAASRSFVSQIAGPFVSLTFDVVVENSERALALILYPRASEEFYFLISTLYYATENMILVMR